MIVVNHEESVELSSSKNALKTILQGAMKMITMVRNNVDKNTKVITKAELDEVIEFMKAVNQIEDEMTSVKVDLQDLKQTMRASKKVATGTWAAVASCDTRDSYHYNALGSDEMVVTKFPKWFVLVIDHMARPYISRMVGISSWMRFYHYSDTYGPQPSEIVALVIDHVVAYGLLVTLE